MNFWNSIDNLGRVQDAINLTLAIAGVITAILAVVSYIGNQRLDDLKNVRDSAQQARLDAAEGAARNAQAQATELAARQQPRALSQDSARALRDRLAAIVHGPVTIQFPGGDPEAQTFGAQIRAVFEAAGWPRPDLNAQIGGPVELGLAVRIADAQREPAHARPILEALKLVDANAKGVVFPGEPPDAVRIVVGHKQ